MKRFWICIAVLVLLCAASVVNIWYLTQLTGRLSDSLAQAQAFVEQDDWETAQEITEQAQQLWDDSQGYIYTILLHSEADEVQVGFQEVLELLEWGECAEYTSVNTRLISNIQLLAEMEQLNILNLL